ncbi:LOW QUALITY PROTEIN: hypothetical protein Cgig2_014070 [Carnegiea gigantea]|uniref:F-box domain-containing protein n=1 Tax=Carnegiea gigantea TaxID=171969 RepID=A0A9Q1KXD7_9CARY|nr:LOW QUALITY PROTEIN: hypothetical protein Cgig2_014070 [Carnegiea gigantea]
MGSRDRISNLPGEIKQQILSLLSTSDAIRTSVLSSDWRYEWINLPSLNFGHKFWKNSQKKKLTDNQEKSVANHHRNGCNFSAKKELALDDIDNDNEDSEGNGCSERNKLIDGDHSVSNIKALGYVQYLDRVIQMIRTHQPNETRKLRIHLPRDIGFGSTSVSMDLVTTGDELQRLTCYVQEYRFLRSGGRVYLLNLPKYLSASSKSLSSLKLTGNLRCKMFKSMSMEGTRTEFSSLRKISISWSRLDQWVVDTLLASCGTALEELMFLNCEGLKSLRLSGLPKLRVLRVLNDDLNRVKLNAPQLHSLRLRSSRSLASCRNLVELSFCSCSITNDFFNQGLAKFACLKNLNISSCFCLTHIMLASNSLADLQIFDCRKLLRFEIDTPNLISFSYSMCEKSDFLSLVSHTPIAPLRAELYLTPCHAINHTQWHSKVVELLANFSCAQDIKLTWTANEALIIPQDLRESLSPPLWGVQCVDLSLYLPPVLVSGHSILQYLDTVLWLSSRPKGIHLSAIGTKVDDASYEDSYEDSDEGGHEDLGSWHIYLELQYKKDTGNVEHSCGCYPGQLISCWRHSLKDFKIKYQNRLEAAAILREFFDNALAERRK